MNTKLLLFAFFLAAAGLSAQEQQTVLQRARVTGGFGAPFLSLGHASGKTVLGGGAGGGLVFGDFYVGLVGVSESFGPVRFGKDHLSLDYGGLWFGYTRPSQRVLHFYTSVKVAGGAASVVHADEGNGRQRFEWPDLVFVALPEAGLEINITQGIRLSTTVGYRFVGGFEGWNHLGPRDLDAPVYSLTLRFGRFAKRAPMTVSPG